MNYWHILKAVYHVESSSDPNNSKAKLKQNLSYELRPPQNNKRVPCATTSTYYNNCTAGTKEDQRVMN